MEEVVDRIRKIPTDLTIVCQDGNVFAIKSMIAASSPAFAAMLSGKFIENNVINMPEDPAVLVQAAVNYIQLGELPTKLSPEDLMVFLDKYCVEHKSLIKKLFDTLDGLDRLFKFDRAMSIYQKICDNVHYKQLRMKAAKTIAIGIRMTYELVCDACGDSTIWTCNSCKFASFTHDLKCDDGCDFKKPSFHQKCTKNPRGYHQAIKIIRKNVDPYLLGRALYDYYIGIEYNDDNTQITESVQQ